MVCALYVPVNLPKEKNTDIKAEDIENTPTFGTKLNTDYILGMAKMGGGVKILLDTDKVLNSEELTLLKEAA